MLPIGHLLPTVQGSTRRISITPAFTHREDPYKLGESYPFTRDLYDKRDEEETIGACREDFFRRSWRYEVTTGNSPGELSGRLKNDGHERGESLGSFDFGATYIMSSPSPLTAAKSFNLQSRIHALLPNLCPVREKYIAPSQLLCLHFALTNKLFSTDLPRNSCNHLQNYPAINL
jgi:hypothetical protein